MKREQLTAYQLRVREEFIMDMSFRREMNNEEIGVLFNISRERVRQIIDKAKLKSKYKN